MWDLALLQYNTKTVVATRRRWDGDAEGWLTAYRPPEGSDTSVASGRARLSGLPESERQTLVHWSLQRLGLGLVHLSLIERKVGGMKRKVRVSSKGQG